MPVRAGRPSWPTLVPPRLRGGPGAAMPAGAVIGPSFPAVLAATQTGDEQAFAVVWRELQPAVLSTGGAPTAAEDLAADTWVSVIRGLGRFRGDERAFRAWYSPPPGIGRSTGTDRRPPADQPLPVELLAERTPPTTRPRSGSSPPPTTVGPAQS